MDFRKLIAAGTKKCGRSPFQKLNVKLGMDLGRKVDILLVKQPLDSVKHSIYLVKATLYCILVYACKTGINYRCWAAGLSYNNISFFFAMVVFLLYFEWMWVSKISMSFTL